MNNTMRVGLLKQKVVNVRILVFMINDIHIVTKMEYLKEIGNEAPYDVVDGGVDNL